ncbi:5-formyltetrahydrofolate cyclo-ligase [Mycoplasmopsis agalactiae]|uniref:5-formyltetrahydrofolate cyclo-ligase n=1 Tax=Mycoplasmopsis agalactiae (strain NCTC 10123 / CIP 59.7 / PG2) TaxID=347257 RepID=A5IZ16_MYCAP|nr:5-formyltetrahydrofolate cyclo-ligase [Mycoplasmopsis agalactiae]MCE6057307.1 5-formyltetrahydrofolate cyclo-ligase [Mycoplasmopsis agalactiae]MCE6079092.1 5-formyltetrahydrofolate cyclo-ligase [Mycoplasmopsis agalactiae]MCE6095479.1 5-formyltetrahydrofolate cyclo-ligase [Mycoplasmopsis agalactiae]MCE6114733.1 5-formyltetrahydrofolate cyclo-ligase [Mycoplasmopsis agalactiae]NLS34184.1 5-formyltetrahydrofolate cyclo-ligase [Mycoplasmopsis agalactiae]
MNKRELRKLMIAKRKELTPEYKTNANLAISTSVIYFINKNRFKQICIYLPTKYETDTSKIIEWCLHNNIKVYVPKVLEDNKMVMTLIDNRTDYQLNLFNINESKSDILCNIEEIDCVFTPLVAFDNSLNRIGMGKGFYDRFFSENNGNYLKIGLCFNDQLVEKIESETSDQMLDLVITESKIYS